MTLFSRWLPLAVIISLLAGLIYVTMQQTYRRGANDPQIQLAEDAAFALVEGDNPDLVIPTQKIDISQSLAPYLIIYANDHTPLAGSGLLDGVLPSPPTGVFGYVAENGTDTITWQPRAKVRNAIVMRRVTGTTFQGYVLAGRSLREIEKREDQLARIVVIGWLVTLWVSFTTVWLSSLLEKLFSKR